MPKIKPYFMFFFFLKERRLRTASQFIAADLAKYVYLKSDNTCKKFASQSWVSLCQSVSLNLRWCFGRVVYQSAINQPYLVTLASVVGWDVLGSK